MKYGRLERRHRRVQVRFCLVNKAGKPLCSVIDRWGSPNDCSFQDFHVREVKCSF